MSPFPISRLQNVVETLRPPKWLIEGVLEEQTLSAMIAEEGSFKTFIALDMALSVACGAPWHGRKTSHRPVVYCCGEGNNNLASRLLGWLRARELEDADPPLYVLQAPVDLADPQVARKLADEIEGRLVDDLPGLIVVDTLSRFGFGIDENSNNEMSGLVNTISEVLAARLNSAVMLVHHPSKASNSDKGRGASSLDGALDTRWKLSANRVNRQVVLSNSKMKDHAFGESFSFRMEVVEIPEANTSTLYPVLSDVQAPAKAEPEDLLLGVNGHQSASQRLYRLLIAEYDERSSLSRATPDWLHGRGVHKTNLARERRVLCSTLASLYPQAPIVDGRDHSAFLSCFERLAAGRADVSLPRAEEVLIDF